MQKLQMENAFKIGWEIFKQNFITLSISFFVTSLFSLTIILAPIMMAGFTYMLLKASRGEAIEIGDVFHGFSDFGRYFVGGLLYVGVVILGALCFGIGVFASFGILMFFFPIMVDKHLSAGEALSKCWTYFKSDWPMAILMAIVLDVIMAVGEAGFYILVFVTGAFSYAVLIAAYNQVFNTISQKEIQ
jgi:membrane-anchored glycerophosphoryl diester phosphodiesterase (GDPDase)